jgi:hypothetical protein
MNGNYVGVLSVYFFVKKNDGSYERTQEPVWRKKSSHGEHWQFGQVLYPGNNQSVENFVFEGTADSFELGKFIFKIQERKFFWLRFYYFLFKGQIAIGKPFK